MYNIATHSQSTNTPILKRLVIRHPLIAFFVIAFAGEWIVFLPLVLSQNGQGLLPYSLPALGPIPPAYWFTVLASIAGPTLASFTVTTLTAGTAGVRQLLRRYMLWRVGLCWYLLVLLGLPLIQLACASIFLGIAPLKAFIQEWPLYFTTFLPNILIITFAVQIWEEGGWSGYAVPNLQNRFGALRAALILGPLWGLFHLPVFLVPGQIFDQRVGLITIIVQLVLTMIVGVLLRIIMNWVFNNTKGSILIAILFHSSLDASNGGSAYITHLLPASQLGIYGLVTFLVPLVAAVLLLIFTKGRLSYKPDREEKQIEVSQAMSVQ
ncbi:MAG TPA: CPBP family intramembrane glutamic endopeptidase [Ktedonobacteraceae bacterium]